MKLLHFSKALVLSFGLIGSAHADSSTKLVGSWCFYEQTAAGNTVPEKVDVKFNDNSTYNWTEGVFEQKGTWEVKDEKLIMSDVGTHAIISLDSAEIVLKRMSVMKFKKGKCDASSFSDQDITRFHNAASTGEVEVLNDYIGRGIDINASDWNRGDTALIKASKFCKVSIAKILLNNGANREILNESGKRALDYAKSSSFHDGCGELVKLLN